MKKYILLTSLLIAVLSVVYFIRQYLPFELHSTYPSMLIFYSLQSVVIAVVIGYTIGKPDIFGLVALGIIVLRLITALFYLVVMYLLGTIDASLFAIQFMALYLCFLAFELTTVLANLRQN